MFKRSGNKFLKSLTKNPHQISKLTDLTYSQTWRPIVEKEEEKEWANQKLPQIEKIKPLINSK